jgi:epsilon-lactone hydrolase
MSLRRRILNFALRWSEKPYLRRADPLDLRERFEKKARFWFRPPRGVTFEGRSFAAPSGPRKALWIAPENPNANSVILYLHGGAFIFGSPDTHGAMLAKLAQLSGAMACLPRYRLAPEHPFPAGLDDTLAAYQDLFEQGYSADQIILGGDSAGGGLALALLHVLIADGQPLPAGVFCLSPLTDLTFSGKSWAFNAEKEVLLPAERASELVGMYLGENDATDPRASPLFGDFTAAPPVYFTVGDSEILLDDTLRMAEILRQCGVDVSCDVAQGLPHVWPLFQGLLPEADATLVQISGWIAARLEAQGDS